MDKKLEERLQSFADDLQDPTKAVTMLATDDMAEASQIIFQGGYGALWVMMLGIEGALQVAFMAGAAFQRKVQEDIDSAAGNILKDIDLGKD